MVAIYSGEIASSLDGNLSGTEHEYKGTQFYYKETYSRGIASFFQDLPSDKNHDAKMQLIGRIKNGKEIEKENFVADTEIYCIKFCTPGVRDNLATANLEKEYLIYQNAPVVAMFASRDIHVGEQLGMTYGVNYWRSIKIHPCLFDKSGAIIPKRYYQRIYGNLYFPDATYTGDLKYLGQKLSDNRLKVNGPRQFSESEIWNALIAACALSPDVSPAVTILNQWGSTAHIYNHAISQNNVVQTKATSSL